MTTSLPVFDFSTTPEERAAENAKIDAAIANAEKAMKDAPAVRAIKEKQFKDALVAESIAAKPLIKKAKKATPKAKGKAGRIVGISADENAYIQEVLIMIADDPELGQGNPNYVKIQARYNK